MTTLRRVRAISVVALGVITACGSTSRGSGSSSTGVVTISSRAGTLSGMTFGETLVLAGFVQAADGTQPVCDIQTMGACEVIRCTTESADAGAPMSDAGAARTQRSAGTITVSGGGRSIELVPGANNTYTARPEMGQLFPAGTMLTIEATGDSNGVPSFSALLRMPSSIVLTAPLFNPTAPTTIPRNAPLALSWTGGTASKVRVELGSTPNASVRCFFDAAAGNGIVPADALAAISPGDGLVVIAAADVRDQRVGEFSVSLSASSSDLNGGAARARFQ
jgi:hypothetical protein